MICLLETIYYTLRAVKNINWCINGALQFLREFIFWSKREEDLKFRLRKNLEHTFFKTCYLKQRRSNIVLTLFLWSQENIKLNIFYIILFYKRLKYYTAKLYSSSWIWKKLVFLYLDGVKENLYHKGLNQNVPVKKLIVMQD